MHLDRHTCRRITAAVFLLTTLGSAYLYQLMNFTGVTSIAGALFTAIITAGLWTEASYRFLVKEATAPLDKLAEKI
jgi:hypothetical protein